MRRASIYAFLLFLANSAIAGLVDNNYYPSGVPWGLPDSVLDMSAVSPADNTGNGTAIDASGPAFAGTVDFLGTIGSVARDVQPPEAPMDILINGARTLSTSW